MRNQEKIDDVKRRLKNSTGPAVLQSMMSLSFDVADGSGWWTDKDGNRLERNKGELIALMHSELSECLEGVRKGKPDEHLPDFLSEEVELADALHRIFDYAVGHNLRVAEAFFAKALYNADRADHKPEARNADDGKKF